MKNMNCKCCVSAFAEKKNMLMHIEFVHVTKNYSKYYFELSVLYIFFFIIIFTEK